MRLGEPEVIVHSSISGADENSQRAVASAGDITLSGLGRRYLGGVAFLMVERDGKVLAVLEGEEHVAYTIAPDGHTIISGGRSIQAFDLAAVTAAAANVPDYTLKGDDLAKLARSLIGHQSEILALATTRTANSSYRAASTKP